MSDGCDRRSLRLTIVWLVALQASQYLSDRLMVENTYRRKEFQKLCFRLIIRMMLAIERRERWEGVVVRGDTYGRLVVCEEKREKVGTKGKPI